MFSEYERNRVKNIINQYLKKYELDLDGLVVYTEAASGYYIFTPLICAMAGAKKVYAITRDSKWGKSKNIQRDTYLTAKQLAVDKCIEIVFEKKPKHISQSDIITNSGFVRPIDSQMVSWMKKTAVIPLMWETWEFRPEEIDLDACREKGILILGTDEHKIDFIQYAAYLIWKMLFDCNIEIYKNKFFIFSSNPMANILNSMFHANRIDYRWTSFDGCSEERYSRYYIDINDKKSILLYLSECDAIICEEKSHNKPVIGKEGIITAEELKESNGSILFILRSGVVDYKKMKELGIRVYPEAKSPFGHSTICSYALGPRPVIELTIAGLKVGEKMAIARKVGLSLQESAEFAIRNSPAMDFVGECSWLGLT